MVIVYIERVIELVTLTNFSKLFSTTLTNFPKVVKLLLVIYNTD